MCGKMRAGWCCVPKCRYIWSQEFVPGILSIVWTIFQLYKLHRYIMFVLCRSSMEANSVPEIIHFTYKNAFWWKYVIVREGAVMLSCFVSEGKKMFDAKNHSKANFYFSSCRQSNIFLQSRPLFADTFSSTTTKQFFKPKGLLLAVFTKTLPINGNILPCIFEVTLKRYK